MLRDVPLEVQHTLVVNLIVEDGVARRPLLHKFREHACIKCLVPMLIHCPKDPFTHRSAGPEGDNFLFIGSSDLICYDKGRSFPAVEDTQVFQCVTAQFGVSGSGFRCRTSFAYNQLTVIDANGPVLHQVFE